MVTSGCSVNFIVMLCWTGVFNDVDQKPTAVVHAFVINTECYV